MPEAKNKKKKTRLIVKHGQENIILPVISVALLYIDERSVFVIDQFSKKYSFNKKLTEIEEELDKNIFFRANRQMIINIHFIKGFTVCECNKLKVNLTLNLTEPVIVISQETAPLFKAWICES
jgi:two-component system LytT family response regulator